MRIYAKIFCKTAVFGNNCSGRYIFVATIIAYLRHADRVGGFATPGWQHLRRYQPGANHNRVPPARCSLHSPTAHHTPYRHNGCGTITHRHDADQRISATMPMPHLPHRRRAQRCHPLLHWRAERAVPRRGTIMVSPTQSVPEVLAVWGRRYKKG